MLKCLAVCCQPKIIELVSVQILTREFKVTFFTIDVINKSGSKRKRFGEENNIINT